MQAPQTTTLTADGSTPWFRVQGTLASFLVAGALGGGSFAIEVKSPGGTAVPMCNPPNTPIALDKAQVVNLEVTPDTEVRMTLSGSTAPSAETVISNIMAARE